MKEFIEKIKLYGFKKSLQFIFGELKNIFYMRYYRGSYSQNGEDLVIHKLLNHKNKGFYVDIGAYDPNRFSNTKYFYKQGWCGINIEPNIQNYHKFLKARPRDINLNIGIGSKPGKKIFYKLFPDTLSTFSKKDAFVYKKIGFKIINKHRIEIQRLDNIISKYCQNKNIDFFSIDTEGFEMEVLKSNDWGGVKPPIICIESYTFQTDRSPSKERREINQFLVNLGYRKVYSNNTNCIYQYN